MKIEICKKEDREKLVDFLRKYWKEDHILVKSPDFLEWQHGNEEGGLDFYIAKDENDEIIATQGFISLSRFDSNLKIYNERWGAIWKVKPQCPIPGIGLLVSRKLENESAFFGGLGMSKDAQILTKIRHKEFGECKQYYIINPQITDFKIAIINSKYKVDPPKSGDCITTLSETLNNINKVEHAYNPIKSLEFLRNRYERHPIYKYHYILCKVNEKLQCILVYRIIEVNGSSCARIVDALGDFSKLIGLGRSLGKLLSSELPNIEYFDMFNHGLSESFLKESGFNVVNNIDGNVIPNYFEPFLQKNITLHYAIFSGEKEKKYQFFKGDDDQDRPNSTSV